MTKTIVMLQQEMEAAAQAQDFERAQRCRDMINLMRGGASWEKAERADFTGLVRQQPGAMGLGTSQQKFSPPRGWKPPPRPDLMTSGNPKRRGSPR